MRAETHKDFRILDSPVLRRLTCERCGREFDCGLGGDCWCAAEPSRLPVPADGADCLCPDCLRMAAIKMRSG